MICADFFAGANLDNRDPLLNSLSHFFGLLPGEQQPVFIELVSERVWCRP
jgi:hypothetical protein